MRYLLPALLLAVGCADGTTDTGTTELPRGGFADGPPPMFWDAPPDGPAVDAGIDALEEDGSGARLEPDMAEPDMAEPDVAEPDVAEPDVAELDAAEPDVGGPDAETNSASPDVEPVEPDMAEPDLPEPDLGLPDAALPDAAPDLPPLPDLGAVGPGIVVLNEVDYDQPGQDTEEFIELANIGGEAVSLEGWRIELINGANREVYGEVLLGGLLGAGELLLMAPPSIADQAPPGVRVVPFAGPIQNGAPDGLRLLDAAGDAVDGLAYEGTMDGVGEGETPAENDPGEGSLTRCAGAPDTDDNRADFYLRAPTPGLADPCD